MSKKQIFALVGMPGSGKSEVVLYLQKKGLPVLRFGDLTEKVLQEQNLTITPENEKKVREGLRAEFGMAVYAEKSKAKIDELFASYDTVVIDGLYSWEEYLFLKKSFPKLILIYIFTRPSVRYQRLAKRKIRPLTEEQVKMRDVLEIEKLNKGGPIAIADFVIDNSEENIDELHKNIDKIL
ncbi:MAG: AAA family ATPase [Candidatus Levyibacteriota bacterium]|nr:MAG: AAA family ATPase [Candidatus Levybacteria bacterium]